VTTAVDTYVCDDCGREFVGRPYWTGDPDPLCRSCAGPYLCPDFAVDATPEHFRVCVGTCAESIVEHRMEDALFVARRAGYDEANAQRVAARAEAEARAGIRNGTASFAGSVTAATGGPVRIQSYAGNYVDPLSGGIDNASTLD
jgi:hypothetical protein